MEEALSEIQFESIESMPVYRQCFLSHIGPLVSVAFDSEKPEKSEIELVEDIAIIVSTTVTTVEPLKSTEINKIKSAPPEEETQSILVIDYSQIQNTP